MRALSLCSRSWTPARERRQLHVSRSALKICKRELRCTAPCRARSRRLSVPRQSWSFLPRLAKPDHRHSSLAESNHPSNHPSDHRPRSPAECKNPRAAGWSGLHWSSFSDLRFGPVQPVAPLLVLALGHASRLFGTSGLRGARKLLYASTDVSNCGRLR